MVALHIASAPCAAEVRRETPPPAPSESLTAWLPDPVETIDAPERRDEPPGEWRVRVQSAWGGSSPAVRRIWWSGGGRLGLEAAALTNGRTRTEGGALWRSGSARLGVGALALPNLGLPGEASGLVRRRLGFGPGGASPHDRAMRAAPGSGADLDGAAVAWRDAVRVAFGRMRRAPRDALALELRNSGQTLRGVLERRGNRTVAHGGLAIEAGRPANRVAAEAAVGPRGATARIDAAARRGPIAGTARWRYEHGRERPGTLDLESAWTARDLAARFRWRSWSPGATEGTASTSTARAGADDGRAEIDLRAGRGGIGAFRLRLGTRPREADGTGGERYAIGDMVVAREPGRTLRLTAGNRAVQSGAGWRRGSAMGAVLELERRHRASFALTAEVVHAEDGTGSYSPGLDVAGGGSIRARTRSGLRAAARGWIGLGDWRCGVAVDDEEVGSVEGTTAREARAPRVNLWLAWSGGSDAR